MSNLLSVIVNQNGYEYDIHSLVKAFYPAQDVKVFVPDSDEKDIVSSDEGLPDLKIDFEPEMIRMSIVDGGRGRTDFGGYKVELEDGMDRPHIKNCLKKLIYTALSEHTGRQLPWGTLTGIRPTKIPMTMMEEDITDEEIMQYMQDTYLISKEKGELAIEIARREKALLDTLHYEDGYSLYIGIPFCPTTCLYCSFTSYPIFSWEKRVSEYLTALEKEIDFVSSFYQDKILDTIYIGGGTPTTLKAPELERLLSYIEARLDLSHLQEFTVEAGRADSITRDKLGVLRKHGVTRISVNPQTMNQKTLDLIGRRHTVEQVKEAFALAREVGFTNINMDIILGLPEETEADVQYTIDEIVKMQPDSLTVHSLAVKRASRLKMEAAGTVVAGGTQEESEEMMRIASEGAARMGLAPYYLYRQKNMAGNLENVGFASEGKAGIYNILIMEEKQDIVALGAGTVSKHIYADGRIERGDNVKAVEQYMERIDEMIGRKEKLYRD